MPKPEQTFISFDLDGREVRAPEGSMLVDGAKYGDVEIPVFCYEPKLGPAVGACRMCLVEIEGIPKLQTACSTPVRDGMAVTTQSDRVRAAQSAVVEFLLINHPLDCPVCDKGGECPLQDVTYGWGPGRSRFIEPKRHFKKPLALSPLIHIDRERCILCYRCVRFSQDVAEDWQLVLLERGDHTFVGTNDARPYVAPFSGNIIELCPVGALTSAAYRFRARPWDDVVEGGSICTLCPSQCNVRFTVRDDAKVLRVLARDNEEVDDGWLCDKGRFGYQSIHSPERITQPMVRDGGALRPVSWERALGEAVAGLEKAGAASAAIVGGQTTNEEGLLLQILMRDLLGSPHIDSRPSGTLDPRQARALASPGVSASVTDIEYAGAILVVDADLQAESPILELRVRKAARLRGARLIVASSRPSALDARADARLAFAPGAGDAALAALASALGDGRHLDDLARRAGAEGEEVRAAAQALAGAGPVVILWGERLSHGDRGRHGVAGLLAMARALGVADTEGAGLMEVPTSTNARGLREVGCLPNLLPGLEDAPREGRAAREIAASLGEDLTALVLLGADPLRTHPERESWERALDAATHVVAFAGFMTDSLEEHASVVFPAESYAERDGTITHPDGRVQRLRQAVQRPEGVRPVWSVILDLTSGLVGSSLDLLTGPMVTAQVSRAVAFYAGLTQEEIGGRGVRWQEREAAAAIDWPKLPSEPLETPPEPSAGPGRGLRLGTAPTLWSGPEVEHSPSLAFLAPRQQAELSAADAQRLGVTSGDEVVVAANGTRVRARAALRDRVAQGSVWLTEGTAQENATALSGAAPRTVEVEKA